jgi:hypothetical protein
MICLRYWRRVRTVQATSDYSCVVANYFPKTPVVLETTTPLISTYRHQVRIVMSYLALPPQRFYGLMFWFSRNRLMGSYLRLMCTSRS